MTSWVRSGALCECIDQEWYDYFLDEEVSGPEIGGRYVIASSEIIDGVLFVKLMGDRTSYEARAFRPVFDEDADVAFFRSLLKGSSEPVLSRESACSR